MHVGAVSYLSLFLTGILLLPISGLAQSLEKVRIVYASRHRSSRCGIRTSRVCIIPALDMNIA